MDDMHGDARNEMHNHQAHIWALIPWTDGKTINKLLKQRVPL